MLGTTIWVGVDASNLGVRRGRLGGGGLDMSVASWVVCCLLLWIVAFPCYLIARGRYTAMRHGTGGSWQQQPGYPPYGQGYGQGYDQAAPMGWAGPPQQPQSVQPQLAQAVQFSPDGRWYWNGQQWLPAQPWPSAPQA